MISTIGRASLHLHVCYKKRPPNHLSTDLYLDHVCKLLRLTQNISWSKNYDYRLCNANHTEYGPQHEPYKDIGFCPTGTVASGGR